MRARQIATFSLGILGSLIVGVLGFLSARFLLGRIRVDREWTTKIYTRIKDGGSVRHLTVLPLIDLYTARDDLTGEAGVSYLVRADDKNILFDMGLNREVEHPSPLLRNMAALGVSLDELDMVVISHAHPDHVGGTLHRNRRAFGPSIQPIDLRDIPAYLPEPLLNPSTKPILVENPQFIAPGVASMGPIPRQLFFLGWTPEQSLAINVEGKGIVLIVGCGHSTLERILERAEMLFDEPIVAVIGGLHYPVTRSRGTFLGLPSQQVFGTGKWPWDPINRRDVRAAIECLKRRKPQLVALSAHDSCDWTLNAFREAFGQAYQELLVGHPIVIA